MRSSQSCCLPLVPLAFGWWSGVNLRNARELCAATSFLAAVCSGYRSGLSPSDWRDATLGFFVDNEVTRAFDHVKASFDWSRSGKSFWLWPSSRRLRKLFFRGYLGLRTGMSLLAIVFSSCLLGCFVIATARLNIVPTCFLA